jgi:hypothetical protein
MSGADDGNRPIEGSPLRSAAEHRAVESGQRPESQLAADGIAVPEPEVEVTPIVAPAPATPVSPAPRPATAVVPPRRGGGSIFFARLVQAIWLGSGVFLGFAASGAFKVLAPADAAEVVGAMLTRWHYIALLAPAILILVEWRRQRARMVMLLFVAVIIAVLQGGTDLRIRRMRMESPVPISSLDRTDPVRKRFGALHGFSSLLLLAQIAVAVGVIAAEPLPED